MTNFLLIRHAATDAIGKVISGRLPGVHLNLNGRRQAEQLPAIFPGHTLQAIYSSPLERARETASPLARHFGIHVLISDALNELNYGAWSGQSLEVLESIPDWHRLNALRSTSMPNRGELMIEA